MRMTVRPFALLMLSGIFLTAFLLATGSQAADYYLGPQDKLKVRVYDWRAGAGDAHEWPALVGDFTVNASGNIAFPIVGEISADHQTTSELALKLSARLRDRVGLTQVPIASVEVLQYRPFYVVGDVDRPGEYAFRPDLTVLQALGIAGGMRRNREHDLEVMMRDALVNRGDVNAIQAERIRLKIHLARLYNEVDGSANLVFQPDTDIGKDPRLTGYIAVEQAALTNFQRQKRAQETSLKESKDFLASEITTLGAKATSIEQQAQISRRELAAVDGLVARGLAVSSRQSNIQEELAQFESAHLDTDLALLHARQDIARAEREVVDFSDRTKSQALSEASEIEAKIATLNERLQTARAIGNRAEEDAASIIRSMVDTEPQYFVLRSDGHGKTVSHHVDEGDLVQPGDTVKILRSTDDLRKLSERNTDEAAGTSGLE